ncbi:ROK family protein [Glutamicibacter sp. AOP5-A2-18]|uniref:ROK family protein n=1 Tax=Glutamicibacter sp. AOP5-A2-18 TaxID=3457656 RepID=UPI004033612F
MQEKHSGTGAVLALDVGGTKIAGAVVHPDGSTGFRAQLPTPAQAGSTAIIEAMASVVAQLQSHCDSVPVGLGIGSAGVIDPHTAKVVSATDTILGWAGTDLSAALGDATGLEVRAVNDVHAHGLGEARFGAGQGADSVMLLAVGTGIGGAFFTGGQLVSGFHHVAGHMGHIDSSYAAGLECSCGRFGHVEAIAAGPGIYRHYQRLANNPDVGDTKAVTTLANSGDQQAHKALYIGGLAAGSAAGSLANVLDPQRIIIAGGMAGAGDIWWDGLRAGFAASAINLVSGTELSAAKLGTDAALIGAASLFWTES